MATKSSTLLAAVILIASAMLAAAVPPPGATIVQGNLMVQDKNYPLTYALAYQTTIEGDETIAVVLTARAVSGAKLKEVMEAEKRRQHASFERPYLKLEYSKTGELKYWSAAAGPTMLARARGSATGELNLQDSRASGKASQPSQSSAGFPTGFDVRFDTALLGAGESLVAGNTKKPGPAADVKPSVTGAFKGNGKEAKLAYVSARWREPFNDKPGIELVFTEKDHSKDKKPDLNASFGKFGSALIISVYEDGGIFGCQVVHPAHKQQGFTSLGDIKTSNFKFADGQVEGELTTDGSVDVFGETWEANLKFVAPLGAIPAELQVPDAKKPATATTVPDEDEDEKPSAKQAGAKPGEKSVSQPAQDQLNVKDLAVTKDATDFEYKTLVEQLGFKSKSDVKAACAELAANLKAQGWTTEGRDMVNPTSSILKRKRGDAALTIFLKPESGGSEVKMMTEGLVWDPK